MEGKFDEAKTHLSNFPERIAVGEGVILAKADASRQHSGPALGTSAFQTRVGKGRVCSR
jgi:hypothetical protein